MQGKYRKIMVDMKRENDAWQFWKREAAQPVCYVESYKEKRAVFFHCRNLLPGGRYHIILIGSADDTMEYQNFGPLHTGGNGELQCYRTFRGPELEAYAFCLLCGEGEEGQMDIIYKGLLFQEDEHAWEVLCSQGKETTVFSVDCDETSAKWYRIEDFDRLPVWAETCLPWMRAYGHYIIGRKEKAWFLGVPGRFLQKEQPLRENEVFVLWQPIRGGEAFYDCPDQMSSRQQEKIFGYWIAEIDVEEGRLRPV